LVFVYQDDHPQASDIYARLVRKLVSWLTLKTEEGDLYEIDTALRPNGNSGLLVSSLSAYTDYQTQRGSNTAWTWEHQAMTRARCCWGSPELMADLEAVRVNVITAPRDAGQLTEEICAMRARLAQARPVPADRFDLKHSPGGMIDVEFVVQHLVLLHSQQHPELRDNVGNIALLHRAQAQGLLPDGLGVAAADAYRQLRHRQHQARLNEEPTQVPLADWTSARDTILALWAAVLGPRSA
jgi:glutamate-ammonia-ligase adenylyltransferase